MTGSGRPTVLIVGGGIAGAGLGYELSGRASVLLLEREGHCGYHATGRSAASFTETYGPTLIRRLAIGSRSFLQAPPACFAAQILSARGTVTVARHDQLDALETMLREATALVPAMRSIDPAELQRRVPILRDGYVAASILEPDAMDIDVNGLHAGYLAGLRAAGGRVITEATVLGTSRKAGLWHVETTRGAFAADILVDAAGAWADEVAEMAGVAKLGLVPKRRTALTVDVPPGTSVVGWPLIDDVSGEFYFKADAGALFVSPADATPVPPSDVQPEELDIAIAIDRLQQATTLPVSRIRSAWAGLRTFAPDGNPVVGRDDRVDDFVWLAGQGGYGIKTSPALSRVAAAAILDEPFPPDLAALGLAPADLLRRTPSPHPIEEHA